jgi:hypothetical protein
MKIRRSSRVRRVVVLAVGFLPARPARRREIEGKLSGIVEAGGLSGA